MKKQKVEFVDTNSVGFGTYELNEAQKARLVTSLAYGWKIMSVTPHHVASGAGGFLFVLERNEVGGQHGKKKAKSAHR